MWNNNELIKTLNITYPIIQAGMAGGVTTPELVAEVSDAGGLGMLGAGYMNPNQLKTSIKDVKKRTSKPFGVNVFIPETQPSSDADIAHARELLRPYKESLNMTGDASDLTINTPFEQHIDIIMEESVPVCSFTFGVPSKEIVQQLKQKQVTLIGTATTVDESKLNEEMGMDAVVAQGSEAGGHRGTFAGPFDQAMIGTMSLVPQVVDHVNIPVIAAGGIMDGRGIAAALMLGGHAAQMGTAFVTCEESGAKVEHKSSILTAEEGDLTITSAFSGKPARGINNKFISEMRQHEHLLPSYPIQNSLTKPIRKEAAKQKQSDLMSLWCGQSPRLSRSLPAAELIALWVVQLENRLNRRG